MPVATTQKEAQLVRTYSLLSSSSKPPTYSDRISPTLVSATSESLYTHHESGAASLLPDMGQITNMPTNSNNDNAGHFFSTHSPPVLNLSPNLSPVEHQRTSPGYDLRETARRRSIQGKSVVNWYLISVKLMWSCARQGWGRSMLLTIKKNIILVSKFALLMIIIVSF